MLRYCGCFIERSKSSFPSASVDNVPPMAAKKTRVDGNDCRSENAIHCGSRRNGNCTELRQQHRLWSLDPAKSRPRREEGYNIVRAGAAN